MSGNRERMREVFDQARRLPKQERAAFLNGLAAADAQLRGQIEDMLAALDEAGSFLSEPTQGAAGADAAATMDATPIREGPGARIGPYKLLQLIGEGGFGSVFMAEQEHPVSRKVALKIIKLGMDTRAVIARFEAERQALALMDHSNIARVLDAGATETGRPYFVMELCKGDAIVEYCDKNSLSIEDRLELFAQVCTAVQHAHTKGVIHRDLKPSNILVSTQDGRPHAKVIDFGIAKATASKLTEKTLFTEHRALIGTPEYMSPEQAEGSLDIDTRTDVYSLGVLLYELLTGTTPFSSKELRSAAYAEIQRIIREVEPPKPSTRLSHNTETLASVAAHRHTGPTKLGPLVRGELDWIVMKALEKDRHRRYETANGLAMDIRRFLSSEPVLAAPPSTAYHIRKFVRRNRVMVTAGSAVAAALLLGAIAFAWQASVARVQRDVAVAAQQSESEQRALADAARAEAQSQQVRAETKEAEARRQEAQAKVQEAEAKQQAAIAEAVVKFQTDMLAAVDPDQLPKDPETNEPLRDGVTVVQTMAAAVKLLDHGSLQAQPLVEAKVRETIAGTLQGLGRYQDAELNMRKSLALRRASLPDKSPGIAASLNNLASLLHHQNKLDEAEPLFREALRITRETAPVGDPVIAAGVGNLAMLLADQNKPAEAEPMFREAVEIVRAALPAGHPVIAKSLNNLAVFLRAQNRLAEAEPLFREALGIERAAYPAGHPEVASGLNNLASLLQSQQRFAEAEPLFREALEARRASLPEGHPEIAASLNNLAGLLRDEGKPAEAEPLFREALAISRAGLSAGHPAIAASLNNLAMLLLEQGKLAEAEPLVREVLANSRAALPPGHPDIALALNNLAMLLRAQDKPADAEPLFREALAINLASLPARHPRLVTSKRNLADICATLGKSQEAASLLREVLESSRAALPKDSPELAGEMVMLAQSLLRLQAWDEAEPLLRECLAIREKSRPNSWSTFNTKSMLGGALLGLNRLAQAEPLLLEGYQGMMDREATIPREGKVRIPEARQRLVQLYVAWDRAEPGKGYDTKAAEWKGKLDATRAAPAAPSTPEKK